MKTVVSTVLLCLISSICAQAQGQSKMDAIYRDESHCLTAADMRGDKDMPISCYCRDAIANAQYVYKTYIASEKDSNLNGTFLSLVDAINGTCHTDDGMNIAMDSDWKWTGPEVVRTYPADDVINRIEPSKRGKGWVERSVPFTVQLVYRDRQGKVIKTETYSAVEPIPEFTEQHQKPSSIAH